MRLGYFNIECEHKKPQISKLWHHFWTYQLDNAIFTEVKQIGKVSSSNMSEHDVEIIVLEYNLPKDITRKWKKVEGRMACEKLKSKQA
jgi:hypothetical protein